MIAQKRRLIRGRRLAPPTASCCWTPPCAS